MAATSRSGWLSHLRNSRPPMGVNVASSTPSSEPCTVPPRMLSVSSRLRRVASSRSMYSLML